MVWISGMWLYLCKLYDILHILVVTYHHTMLDWSFICVEMQCVDFYFSGMSTRTLFTIYRIFAFKMDVTPYTQYIVSLTLASYLSLLLYHRDMYICIWNIRVISNLIPYKSCYVLVTSFSDANRCVYRQFKVINSVDVYIFWTGSK